MYRHPSNLILVVHLHHSLVVRLLIVRLDTPLVVRLRTLLVIRLLIVRLHVPPIVGFCLYKRPDFSNLSRRLKQAHPPATHLLEHQRRWPGPKAPRAEVAGGDAL